MATLNLKSIATLVANQAAAIQANAAALLDFSVGSVLLSFTEANAAIAVWLQGLVLQVLAISRLATSFGTDVDSFVNDYGIYRLPASNSAGAVTFSRYSNTQSALVPVGAQVQSADGTQTFVVTIDTTNTHWNATLNGYLIPGGTTSVTVPVSSVNTGNATNIVAGAVNVLLTNISGVDYVNNNLPLAGGSNGETDSALKTRFVLFFLGLSKGNIYGVEYALASLNVSIAYQIVDQYNYSNVYTPGFFYAVVDDGSGTPSSAFLTGASNAINAVKPLGVQFSVFAPNLVTANPSMTLTTAPTYTHSTVVGLVSAAILANIQALTVGQGLPYSLLAAWAYAIPGVTDVTAILLNGGTSDIAPNPNNRVMPGTITVS